MGQEEIPSGHGLASGEDFSFARLYDTHVDEVYRFVHRRCRDHALAQDVTQETFMAALRKMEDLNEISIGWLITVARNRLVDVLRRQARHATKIRLVGQVEHGVLDIELTERLRVERAFDELSVDHRLILTPSLHRRADRTRISQTARPFREIDRGSGHAGPARASFRTRRWQR